MRVLVVEDEPQMADLIRQGLSKEGLAVDVAGDGEEGMRWRRDQPTTPSCSTSCCPGSAASRPAAASATTGRVDARC